MFLDRFRKPKQEIVQFNTNEYDQFLSDADRVFLEDLKAEALSQTLTTEQSQQILRISEELATRAVANGLPATPDDSAQFIREFYQSIATAEQSKNGEIDSVRFEKFVKLIHEDDIEALKDIRIVIERYSSSSPENNNRVNLFKQHYVNAVQKAGYDFSSTEVESYIDALIAPQQHEGTATEIEPVPTYKVKRARELDIDLPLSRFDLGDIPTEDLR